MRNLTGKILKRKSKEGESSFPSHLQEEPTSKKQKQETSPSSSSIPEKRKRKRLGVNGCVDVNNFIYIAQEEMKETLLATIENGDFCVLMAPSQSGKTSFVTNTLIPAIETLDYFPIFVDIRGVVGTYLDKHDKSFTEILMWNISRYLGKHYDEYDITTMFAKISCIPEFKDKKIVLFLDEIDSIAEVSLEIRKTFLGSLSTMQQNNELYCLHSCIVITNCVGEYLGQAIGNSSFNITNTIYGDYFSEQEAEQLFNEYENERDKKMSEDIRRNIFKLTAGAQGQTVMLTLYHERLCGNENSIDERDWYSSLVSKKFWEYISSHANFKRINSVLKDEMIATSVLNWFKDKKEPTEDVINTLIKSNIWKRTSDLMLIFASPFVEKYVLNRLTWSFESEPLKVLPILEGGDFDFLGLLSSTIKTMNRMYSRK